MEKFEEKAKKFKTEFNGHGSYYSRFLLIGKIDLCKVIHCLDDMGYLDSCGSAKINYHDNGEHSFYFEGNKISPAVIYGLTNHLSCRGFSDDWDGNRFYAANDGDDDYSDYEMEITDDFRDNDDEEDTPTYDIRFKLIDPETNAVFYGGGGYLSSEIREEFLRCAKEHPVNKTTGCNSPYPGIKELYSEKAQAFEDAAENFKQMLYKFYCLIWEKEHPCIMEELIVNYHMSAIDEGYESFDEYLKENGSDGNSSSPVCFEEWEENEYKDEEIIAELLHEVNQVGLLDHYLYIRKKEKNIESEEHINKLKKMLNVLYDEGCNADEDAIDALEFAIDSLSEKETN